MTGEREPTAPIVNITGERVALGPLDREDLADFHRWGNDFNVTRTAGIGDGLQTIEQTEAIYSWITSLSDAAWFIVYERSTMRVMGFTGLRDIDYRNRTAEYAITIGEGDMRGKGYGTETTRLMLDYAFTALGLHNVLLDTLEFNIAGIRASERAGFREIGRRHKCERVGGKAWDMVFMEAVSTEFEHSILREVFAPDQPR